MPSFQANCASLVIPIGTAVSNIFRADEVYEDAVALILYAPTTLDGADVYVIETTDNIDAVAGSVWTVHRIGDQGSLTDLLAPAAGKSRTYLEIIGCAALRINDQTDNVAAERIWRVTKLFRTD